jgi:hypothetical protein
MVPGLPQTKKFRRFCLSDKKLGMVVEDHSLGQLGKKNNKILSPKITKGVIQVVESQPSKLEDLIKKKRTLVNIPPDLRITSQISLTSLVFKNVLLYSVQNTV